VMRGYVKLDLKGRFFPTDLGIQVNGWLQDNFSSIISENYTADLESKLDKISNGEDNYVNFISNFWNNFYDSLRDKNLEDSLQLQQTKS
jgi:DNA topoisomerase-1